MGVWTNVCVRCSASDASYRAYKVIAISDCCASKDEEMHKAGLRDMAIFAKVMTSDEYISDWQNNRDPWENAGQPDNKEK
jgi:nicotinamidase-related amidase